MSAIKKTSLYQRHIDLGAKMVPFAGYYMPLQYSGIMKEHLAVRSTAGLFDVSHMGEFKISGPAAKSFLQFITINDVSQLEPGQAQYNAMCYDDGGIIDDLLVYCHNEYFVLVVNAANIQKDFEWLEDHIVAGVVIEDISEQVNLVAIQGPKSRDIIQAATLAADISKIGFYNFINTEIAGAEVTLSRTGYTGELGYEIYAHPDDIAVIWDILMISGKSFGLTPVGLGARDTLRLEMKYCLYGNDINENTNPYEAGLGWITKIDKGEFCGNRALIHHKSNITRRLICFEMLERAVPRKGYPIYAGEEKIGEVTSGSQSPSLEKGIGLGYVDKPHHKSGTNIFIEIRGNVKKALIVKPPFYKNGSIQD